MGRLTQCYTSGLYCEFVRNHGCFIDLVSGAWTGAYGDRKSQRSCIFF